MSSTVSRKGRADRRFDGGDGRKSGFSALHPAGARPGGRDWTLEAYRKGKAMAHFAAYPEDPEAFRVRRPARRASSGIWSLRIVTGCLVVAALLAIGDFALSWSRSIGEAEGRVADPMPVTLFVGRQRLTVPANMFRFADQRTVGPHEEVDLAIHWPSMEGWTPARRDAFLDQGEDAPVLFVTLKRRATATDSAGRLASVYLHFLDDEALPAPAGLAGRALQMDAALAGEEVYFEPGSVAPFTAHCLSPDGSGFPALCMTEIHAGEDLSIQVRFRKGLIGDWAALKEAIRLLPLRFGVVS